MFKKTVEPRPPMADETNLYAPPKTEQAARVEALSGHHGVLESALNGHVRLDAGAIISESWRRVAGMKLATLLGTGSIWAIYFACIVGVWMVILSTSAPGALDSLETAMLAMEGSQSGWQINLATALLIPLMAVIIYGHLEHRDAAICRRACAFRRCL
jgi:hypothetical protein